MGKRFERERVYRTVSVHPGRLYLLEAHAFSCEEDDVLRRPGLRDRRPRSRRSASLRTAEWVMQLQPRSWSGSLPTMTPAGSRER